MTVEVRYYSRSGNIEKIARSIAKGANVLASDINNPLSGEIDVLFIGGALYAGRLDRHLKSFLKNLNNVKSLVVFSSSASGKTILKRVKKILKNKQINIVADNFFSYGRFWFMHKESPSDIDLKKAEEFSANIMNEFAKTLNRSLGE